MSENKTRLDCFVSHCLSTSSYAESIYDLITIAFLVHQKMDIRFRVLCDSECSPTHTIDITIKQSKRGPNRAHITSYQFSGHKDRPH
jgi:hypothetical protein